MESPGPFSRLVTSNHPPDDLELAAIHEEIDGCTRAASEVQREIQRLDERRRTLDGELERLNRNVKTCKQLLSSLRRVPPEILGEIFKATLDPDDIHHIPLQVSYLCLVCKSWRDAALDTAGLWNKLQLNLRARGKPISFVKVHNWLSRSGTLARFLRLMMHRSCNSAILHPTSCEASRSGLVQFLTNGPTLRRLALFTTAPCCVTWLVNHMKQNPSSTPRPWDQLQCLDLNVALNIPPTNYLGPLIGNLPMVTSFQFQETGVWCYESLPPNLDPYACFLERLVDLHVHDWPFHWLRSLLPFCKILQRLTMDPVSDELEDWRVETGVPIVLPRLRDLEFDMVVQSSEAWILLRDFRMPCLKELKIDFHGDEQGRRPGPQDHHSELCERLGKLLELSNAQLSHLQMSHISITAQGLSALLRKIPSLNRLTLFHVSFGATAFDSPSDVSFLPHLEALELFRLPQGFDHAMICNIFARRVISGSGPTTLKKLTMELAAGENIRESTASVGMLRAGGAEVLIYCRRARGY